MAIQLPVNSTGTVIDTVTIAAKDREIVVLGDPSTAAAVMAIKNADPAGNEYAPVVREVYGKAIKDQLIVGAAAALKAEDAPHVSGDAGVEVLFVRKDAGGALAATDGDYVPGQTDANGNLRVAIAAGGDGAIVDGVTPTIVATVLDFANSNPLAVRLTDTNGDYISAGAGTQYTEDAPAAADPIGGVTILVRKDTLAGLTSADGDNVAARGTDKGEQYVKHVDAIPVTDNAGSLTVDGTVAVSTIAGAITPGTGAGNLGKAEDAAHVSGDTGVMMLGVENTANTAISGTAGDYTPLGVDAEGSIRNIGNRAHDAVDAGAPMKVGMRAVDHGANPTAVAAADRTDCLANRAGVPFVIGGHPNPITLEVAYTAAQTNAAIVTVAAGSKIVVTRIATMLAYATTVGVGFRIGFGTATTPTTTGVVQSHPGLAPGSGISEGNGGGILGIGADDEDLRITSDVPTTGSLRVVLTYYTVPA